MQDGNSRPNKLIDTKISTPLFDLLGFGPGEPVSLTQRNLLRGLTFSLPSGQRIAHAMKIDVLDAAVFDNLKSYKVNFEHSTPLWHYVLNRSGSTGIRTQAGKTGCDNCCGSNDRTDRRRQPILFTSKSFLETCTTLL